MSEIEKEKEKNELDWTDIGHLDDCQKSAIVNALEYSVSVINGQAGTGKSYVAKRLARMLKREGWKVSMVAPTGKAALRNEGRTIHAWLEPIVEETPSGSLVIRGFTKKQFAKKECLIVDECSMIDRALWLEIFKVFETSYHMERKLVFIGDTGQLEPVGDGTPFLSIIENEDFPITTLEVVHRTESGNDIIEFADYIRNNKKIPTKDFKNVKKTTRQKAIEFVLEDPLNNQILSPMKMGENGTENINKEIQKQRIARGDINEEVLFKAKVWDDERKKFVDGISFHLGDKIIITRNHWPLDITNGTTGIILGIEQTELRSKEEDDFGFYKVRRKGATVISLVIKTDVNDATISVPLKWVEKNIDLAYSITVHKAQGSEYNKVFLFATKDQFMVRDKKLLYTAITRARDTVYVIQS